MLYIVNFYIKKNRTEYLAYVQCEAPNAKEACRAVKLWYHEKTGRNAFRPSTHPLDECYRKWYEQRGNVLHFREVVHAQPNIAPKLDDPEPEL